jgi:hypothetical protein
LKSRFAASVLRISFVEPSTAFDTWVFVVGSYVRPILSGVAGTTGVILRP